MPRERARRATRARMILTANAALIRANLRYWPLVKPRVRLQLQRWEDAAGAIPDPELRGLALTKLRGEHFNVQAATTLATLAPRVARRDVIDAIVALQVLYDYLDILGEQPLIDPLRDGERLFEALRDCLSPAASPRTYYPVGRPSADGGYLQSLVGAVYASFERLPGRAAVAQSALASAQLCAQAQTRNHAAVTLGAGQAQQWALSQPAGSGLGWQEFLAGAAGSILAVHALIAAASRPQTTVEQAGAIADLYLYIGALTMLDSVVDRPEDTQAGQRGYLDYYGGDQQLLELRLRKLVQSVATRAQTTVDGAHHLMTMVGVIAYYGSAPSSASERPNSVASRVGSGLGPVIAPTLALMRCWRIAKRISQLGAPDLEAQA